MSADAHAAMRCFSENVDLFAGPQDDAEKYNLYNGLALLARAINDIGNKLDKLNDIYSIVATLPR